MEFESNARKRRLELRLSDKEIAAIENAAWITRKPASTFLREVAVAASDGIVGIPGDTLHEKRTHYDRKPCSIVVKYKK